MGLSTQPSGGSTPGWGRSGSTPVGWRAAPLGAGSAAGTPSAWGGPSMMASLPGGAASSAMRAATLAAGSTAGTPSAWGGPSMMANPSGGGTSSAMHRHLQTVQSLQQLQQQQQRQLAVHGDEIRSRVRDLTQMTTAAAGAGPVGIAPTYSPRRLEVAESVRPHGMDSNSLAPRSTPEPKKITCSAMTRDEPETAMSPVRIVVVL